MTSHLLAIHEQVLATRGVGGYRQYRIPALAATRAGTVLAAYDGRPNLDDLPNPIDLLVRRSSDSGRTWTDQQVVRSGVGLQGFGDPSLLVDSETGRIIMFHAAGTHAGFFEAVEGLEPDDAVQHADLSFSDDDGHTWQHRRLTDQLKVPGVTGLFAAAGQGIQIHTGPFSGRLVQQFVLLVAGQIMAASAYSDDHGDSWTLGKLLGPGPHGVNPNENKVVALHDGRLLLHSRATPVRLAAYSDDGGASWSDLTPIPDLPDPSDNGSLTRFDGLPGVAQHAAPETDGWLLASNNNDPVLRRNTTLSLSTDNGASWPRKLVLCPGSSAYSTACRLPDGNIGVLYERQGYRDIVFASVPTALLLAAEDTGNPTKGGLDFSMVLRSITPGRPADWQDLGESHALPASDASWDAHTWKEIGHGYGAQQILGTREAQDLNYGPIIPGYKAGDIFAFTGLVTNNDVAPATAVTLHGPGADAFGPTSLNPSEEARFFTPAYTVTSADIAAGAATLSYEITAEVDGGQVRIGKKFAFNTTTGEISEQLLDVGQPGSISPAGRKPGEPLDEHL
ncbi:Sialidase precursor [Arthrobacter ulcerisalmonis]|uniref:exo-alpha-sialidase n=1 Tax=Arthrobacter ulcerisalmonis TaxID=2483813 RepID=A0A3P5X7Z3_9MICC|nr:sialidase family protein [Arthrobacter ulcerisalmonis]VDC26386.1 Sialidase precursor [Arthrobacter ulcerisalmonis]